VRWWRAVVLVAAVGLVAACDVGSIRRPAPVRPPAPPSTRSTIVEVRQARVPVPRSFHLQTLTFVDSARGYALFTRCGESSGKPICEASLAATMDGGRSWSPRRLPRSMAADHQIVVSDNGAVMLLADPYGWYRSRDGGLTFRRTGPADTPPDDYYTGSGRFLVWRSDNGESRLMEYVDHHRQDLAVQPPLSDGPTDAKYDESGRLWTVGIEDGKVVVALSRDEGRTWQRQAVAGPNGGLVSAWLEISAGGGDVWLLASTGPYAFPMLWRLEGTSWAYRPAVGHPPDMLRIAPLGGGALAVSLRDGAGLVNGEDGDYADTGWPLAGAQLRVLADGTLMASSSVPGEIFLGLGHGVDRQWVKVGVMQS
jgi:CDGSH-type Zn-finger protein